MSVHFQFQSAQNEHTHALTDTATEELQLCRTATTTNTRALGAMRCAQQRMMKNRKSLSSLSFSLFCARRSAAACSGHVNTEYWGGTLSVSLLIYCTASFTCSGIYCPRSFVWSVPLAVWATRLLPRCAAHPTDTIM